LDATYQFAWQRAPKLPDATFSEAQRYIASWETRRGNPTGANQHAAKEELSESVNSSRTVRVEENKIGRGKQQMLDGLARRRRDLLVEVNAGKRPTYLAAKEAGIVKVMAAPELVWHWPRRWPPGQPTITSPA
jgi:hypothetical protein